MKKSFEIKEVMTYIHNIEVEVDDEEDFEDFAEEVILNLEDEDDMNRKDVAILLFKNKYGDKNINYVEDGSPDIECEDFDY